MIDNNRQLIEDWHWIGRRYRSSNSFDRAASIRRISRRLPLTRGITMPSYPVVSWRSQAITAASARRSMGMRFVRATVPLPTGVAWAVTARARR